MKPENEPAFPQPMVQGANGMTCGWDGYGMGGMTLRDYFAAKAMQAICHTRSAGELNPRGDMTFAEIAAIQAYQFADALLAERAK